MRITSISVNNFLALTEATVKTDAPLIVLTGANGTGKSTLIEAVGLARDAVRAAIRRTVDFDALWATAGHDGAESFEVRIGIRFDALDERNLFDAFFRAALLPLLHADVNTLHVPSLVNEIDAQLPSEPAAVMTTGELVVQFDSRQRSRWVVGWQFDLPHGPAHVQLLGRDMGRLVDGSVGRPVAVAYQNALLLPTNDILDKVRAGSVGLQLREFVPRTRIAFAVEAINSDVEPPSVGTVFAETGSRPSTSQDRVQFASVLDTLLSRRLYVTDNHRALPLTQFTISDLAAAPDLRDGSLLALELHRLKNGSAAERARFSLVQDIFARMTGDRIDCVQTVVDQSRGVDLHSGELAMLLMPTVQVRAGAGNALDVPLKRAGAGAGEALLLATLLADERRSILLDEPAVHVSPTGQRRLLAFLRSRRDASGQVVVVTHNPDLVPARDAGDLASIVRLSRAPGQRAVNQLALNGKGDIAAKVRLLASSEMRSILFAAGVVLCEGPTDFAVLQRWLDEGVTLGDVSLPTPDERNVTFLSVDGHASFGPAVELAEVYQGSWTRPLD